MSFTIYKPAKWSYVGGSTSTVINQTVDISGVNIDISANINVDISNISLDVSGTFTTDICQYPSLYWQNVNKTIGKVSLADSANIDAFGRLRVSNPETLFDGKMIDSSQNIIFDSSWNNGGRLVYLQNESAMRFDISAANSFVKRQTHYYSQYQPGKSLAILASFYFGTTTPATVTRRVGWFDDNEGIYFEQSSTGLSWNIRSLSAPSITQTQSQWNIDRLDGTGPSGFTLSMANTNLMFIDVEWLGVGRVRIGFVINGMLTYCHQFTQALSSVYIKSPNLPVRYEIRTTNAQSFDVSMKQICCTIMSEGGYSPLGLMASYLNENEVTLDSTNYIPVISIRLRPGLSKGELKPLFYNLVGGGGSTLYYRVLRNATLTTPSWTNVNDYSQVDIASVSATGGQIMDTGFVIGSQRLVFADIPDNLLVFQQDMNGTPDTLTIVMKAEVGAGSGKKVRTSITWQEIV